MRTSLSLLFMEPFTVAPSAASDWWALGWDTRDLTGVDRWYEIHHPRIWHNAMSARLCDNTRYAGWLTSLKGEKCLWKGAAEEKGVRGDIVEFPIDAVTAIPGVGNYLASSMAFMLCHAVLEGYEDITIHGCDFRNPQWQERLFEKPNLAYLIGLFRARGVRITVPETSTLWELELLDDVKPWDLPEKTPNYRVEYTRGRTEYPSAHPPLPWRIWPYYGAESLEEVGATPRKYAAELRREMGI